MSNNSGFSAVPAPTPGTPLVERVRNRVQRVRGRLDRREGLGLRARRQASDAVIARSDSSTPWSRELRALRTVFREMGRTHRQYRRLTHSPISMDLRSAAIAFRQEPSLMSLVPVASFLDDMRLLKW
jgi:ribosomal protein L19E